MTVDEASDDFDLTKEELELVATHFDGDDQDGKVHWRLHTFASCILFHMCTVILC